jgi:hypothetical protein
MSKQINLDDVFRNGLRSAEEPFNEGAWLNMQQKLADAALKPWLFRFIDRRSLNIIAGSIVFTLLLTSWLWFSGHTAATPVYEYNEGLIAANLPSVSNTSTAVPLNAAIPVSFNATVYSNHGANGNVTHEVDPSILLPYDRQTFSPVSVDAAPVSLSNAGGNKISRIAVPSVAFQPKKKRVRKPKFKQLNVYIRESRRDHYDCPTLGIHLNYLEPLNSYAGIGQKPGLGFDFEGYSRNLSKNKFYGVFLGGSGSIAWTGRSEKTEVTLNTPNNDPGITYLQSVYGDLNFVAKVEFGRKDLKLYALGLVGWRGNFISQEIQSKKPVNDFENSSKTVWSNGLLQWGGGIGLRYHFAPGVSLDIRGTYHDADFTILANSRRSVYDGNTGTYNLNYNYLEPEMLSIKVGLLFCISGADSYTNRTSGFQRSRLNINLPLPTLGGGGGGAPVQIRVPGR